ncbi:hypothetical protein ABZ816_27945 [Actinosynnema sp. NPDC047251]|uniref:Putative secreted protein n=1 Tax=Saccharothrix espanaensis (strain ATCC 51144 / DSM 44229 / JCM 9112 / NBRC 15066 / NRRL 15764) TaxID=1179773 RepID=K0JX79_SACES|nr:hypothetical protein [Saccharothrix espanaensis]CCH28838.1 putative secreted protein [Saccharothrix espanaensis DSM 44229]
MTRIAATAVLLALLAVLTPSLTGPGHPPVAGALGHRVIAAEALSEEEPNRESRKVPETRAFSAVPQRFGPDRPAELRPRAATARARHPEPAPLATDHPRARLTPSALQVFRN